jgi:hypothetical protein
MLMTAALLSVSCNSQPASPTAPSASRPISLSFPWTPPTTTTPPNYNVTGVVYELVDGGRRPLPNRRVGLWASNSSTSVSTDQEGRYSAHAWGGRIFASAWERGEQQPCLSTTIVEPAGSAVTLDVEILSQSSRLGNVVAGSRPTVTGTVFTTRNGMRTPAAGANVWVDAANDAYVAFTQTDANGRFLLCRVAAPVQMLVYVGNDEFSAPLAGTRDMTFDIDVPGAS